MQIVIVSCITWGWFLENCAQLLRHAPYFLTAFADEEVEPQKKANFYRYLYFQEIGPLYLTDMTDWQDSNSYRLLSNMRQQSTVFNINFYNRFIGNYTFINIYPQMSMN